MSHTEPQPHDLLFIGHLAIDEIHHFGGEISVGVGSAVLCGALAAARVGARVAVITRMALQDEDKIAVLRAAGVSVTIIPAPATTYIQVIHPATNVDVRRLVQVHNAGRFQPAELDRRKLDALSPQIVHLAGITDQEFDLPLLRALKTWGFRLSTDMQSFVRQVDPRTGEIAFRDVAEKRAIVSLLDYVKLDVVEAEILTGTRDLERAARQLASWGAGEVVITQAEGVLALAEGTAYFSPFTNRSVIGRTGRGDTTFGAYLAWRLDHPVAEALDFAAALVSIKMESAGPFNGTLDDVLARLYVRR
jgi:sugar/nucleoside kinase (ribokinase family)